MAYASIEDVQSRCSRTLTERELNVSSTLLDDAAVIIDAYNENASDAAKKLVSCNMVIRVLGDGQNQMPVGSTQGSVSALGYSQSWTIGSGAVGELYLTKLDKKALGAGRRIGFTNPYEGGR